MRVCERGREGALEMSPTRFQQSVGEPLSQPRCTGGREDADVRMLGEGRPFVLEILRPRHGHPAADQLREAEEALSAASQ